MSLFDKFRKLNFKKSQSAVVYPIPTHLQTIFSPIGNGNSEYKVTGEIRCSCGNDAFEILESNSKNIIKLLCHQCRKEFELFDSGKHGWNGFVCGNDFSDRDLPFDRFICSTCKNDTHAVTVTISSQGKDDFVEECLSNDDSFAEEDWVNAFEWITISLTCKKCGVKDKKWIDMETM